MEQRNLKNNLSKRLISFVVCCAFLSNTILYAVPELSQKPLEIFTEAAPRLVVPDQLGKIDDQYIPQSCLRSFSDCPLVVYLQDAHANLGAQQNIQKIARLFSNQLKIKTILMEGASGTANLDVVRAFPDPGIKEKVTEFWLREVILTGIEAEAILNPSKYELIGIENRNLYQQNLSEFNYALKTGESAVGIVNELIRTLEREREEKDNPGLKEFEKKISTYEKKSELIQQISYLWNTGREFGVKRADLTFVEKLISLIILEKSIQSSKTDLPSEKATFQKLISEIGAKELFSELNELKSRVRERFYKSQDEKKRFETLSDLKNIVTVLSLQATPEDVRFFRNRQKQIEALANTSGIDTKLFEPAITFYRTSSLREKAFLEHVREQVREKKKTFLVTGGFHTEDLKNQFRKSEIPFVTIAPAISPETNYERYYERLSGERPDFRKFKSKFSDFISQSSILFEPFTFQPDFALVARQFFAAASGRSELRAKKDFGKDPNRPLRGGLELPDWVGKAFPTVAWLFGGKNEVTLKGGKNLRDIVHGTVMLFKTNNFESAAFSLDSPWHTETEAARAVVVEKENFDSAVRQARIDLMGKSISRSVDQFIRNITAEIDDERMSAVYLIERALESSQPGEDVVQFARIIQSHLRQSSGNAGTLGKALLENEIEFFRSAVGLIIASYRKQMRDLMKKGQVTEAEKLEPLIVFFENLQHNIVALMEKESRSARDILIEYTDPKAVEKLTKAGKEVPIFVRALNDYRNEMSNTAGTEDERKKREQIILSYKEFFSDLYHLLSTLRHSGVLRFENPDEEAALKEEQTDLFSNTFQRIDFTRAKEQLAGLPEEYSIDTVVTRLKEDTLKNIKHENLYSEFAFQTAGHRLLYEIRREKAKSADANARVLFDCLSGFIENMLSEMSGPLSRKFAAQKQFLEAKNLIVVTQEMSAVVFLKLHEVYPNLKAVVAYEGSPAEHWAIYASGHGILSITPIISIEGKKVNIKSGNEAFADGESGELVVNPRDPTKFEEKRIRERVLLDHALKFAKKPVLATRKGIPEIAVTVGGNAAPHLDLHERQRQLSAIASASERIDLFRTEFGIPFNFVPGIPADETIQNYENSLTDQLVDAGKALPEGVVMRTIDRQPDKEISGIPSSAKGYGLDFYFDDPVGSQILRAQLRAAIRAYHTLKRRAARKHLQVGNPIRVLFPMLKTNEEAEKLIAVWLEVSSEFIEKRVLPKNRRAIPLGFMIETNEAMQNLDALLDKKKIDFVSIGTNDLTKETFGKFDRKGEEFSLLQPKVLERIELVAQKAAAQGIKVTVCGDLGGWRRFALFAVYLAGKYNVRFGLAASSIARLKNLIRFTHYEEVRSLFADYASISTPEGIRAFNNHIAQKVKEVEDRIVENANSFSEDSQIVSVEEPVTSTSHRKDDESGIIQIEVPDQVARSGEQTSLLPAPQPNLQVLETILSALPDEVTVQIRNYNGVHMNPANMIADVAMHNLFLSLQDEENTPAIQVAKEDAAEWLSVRDMMQIMMLAATKGSRLIFRIPNAKTPEQRRAKLVFFLAIQRLVVDHHFGEALEEGQTDPGMPAIADILSDADKAAQSSGKQISELLAGVEFRGPEARSELRSKSMFGNMLGYEPFLTEKHNFKIPIGQWVWIAHSGRDKPEFAKIRFVRDSKNGSKLHVEIHSEQLGGIKPSWYTAQDQERIAQSLDQAVSDFTFNSDSEDFSFLVVRRHVNHKKESQMMVAAEIIYDQVTDESGKALVEFHVLHSRTTHLFGARESLAYELTIRRIFGKILNKVNANQDFGALIRTFKSRIDQFILIRLVLMSIHDPFYRNLLVHNLWLHSEVSDSAPLFFKILELIQKALIDVVRETINHQHARYVVNEHVINYLFQMYHLIRDFDSHHRKSSAQHLKESPLEGAFRRMIVEVWRVFFEQEIKRAAAIIDESSKALRNPDPPGGVATHLDRLKHAEQTLEKAGKYLHRIKSFYTKMKFGYIFQHEDLDLGVMWSRVNTHAKRLLTRTGEDTFIEQELSDLEVRSRHERTINYREATREGGLLPIDVILDLVGFAVAERQPRKIAYSWLFRLINKKKMNEITGLGGRINHVATASLLALYQLGSKGELIGKEIEEKVRTGKRQDVMNVFVNKVRVFTRDAEAFDQALEKIEAHFKANPLLDSDNRRGFVLNVYRDLLNVKWIENGAEYKPFPKEDPRLALLLLYLSGALGEIEKKRAAATDMEPELRAVVQNLLERDVLGRIMRKKGHIPPEDVEQLLRKDRWLSKHLRGITRRIFKDYLHKLGLVRDQDRFPSILESIRKELGRKEDQKGLVMFDRHAPLEPTRDAVGPLETRYPGLVAFYGWATHTQPLGESWSVANGVNQLAERMARGEKILGDLFSADKQIWFGRMHQRFTSAVLEKAETLRDKHFEIARQSEGKVGAVINESMEQILVTLMNEEALSRMAPEEVKIIEDASKSDTFTMREKTVIDKNNRILTELTKDFRSMLPRVVRMVSAEMTGKEGMQEEFPPPSAEKIMEVLHRLYPHIPFIVDVHLTPMAKRPGEKRAPVRLVMTKKARELYGSIREISPGIPVSYHEWREAAENVRAPIDRLVDREDFDRDVPAIFINIAMEGGRLKKLKTTDFAKASQGSYEFKQALEAVHDSKSGPDIVRSTWDPHKISDLLLDYHLNATQNRYIRSIIENYLEQLITVASASGIRIGFDTTEVTAQDHIRSLLDTVEGEPGEFQMNFRIFVEAGHLEKILDIDEKQAIVFLLDHPRATLNDLAVHLGKSAKESDLIVRHASQKIDHAIEELGSDQTLRSEGLIESLKLPWELYEALRNAGIGTIMDLQTRKVNDLMKIKGITRAKAWAIRSALKQQTKPDARSELRNVEHANEWNTQWGSVLGHPQYIEEWVKRHAEKLGDVVVEIAPSAFPATASFKDKHVLMIDIAAPKSVNQVSENHILIQGDIEHPEAISDSRLRSARETLKVRSSGENLDQLLQGQVDSIILPEILNYVDYQRVINQVTKWLKPGGRIFIMNMPNYGLNHLFSERRPQNNRELLEFIKSKGFTTESLEPDADERKMSDTLFMWLIARKAEPVRSELRRDEIPPDVEAAIARTDYKVVLTDLANTVISDEPGAVVSKEIAGLIEGIRSLVKQVTTATGRDLDSTMRTFTDLLSPYARSGQFLYTEGGSRASRFDKRGELKEKPVYVKSIDEEKFLDELKHLIEDSWREVVAKSKSIDAPIEQHELLGRTLMFKLIMPNNTQEVRNQVSDLIRRKISGNPKFKDIKVYPSPRSITITRADKGDSARHLVKAAKAKPSEVLIIGDSELDDPMFRAIDGAAKIYVGETPYPNMPSDVIHFPIHGPKGTQAILQLIFKAMFQEFKRHVKVAAATEQSIEFNELQPVSQNEERWVNGDYVDANEEWMQAGIVMVMNRLQQELGLNLYELAKSINVSDILKLTDVAGDEEFVKNFIAFGAARRTWKFMAAGEDFKTTRLIGMYGDGDIRWLEESVGETAERIREIARRTNHPIKDHWNDKGEPYAEFIASLRALPEPAKQAMRELITLPYHLTHNMGLVEWYFRDHHLKMLDLFWLNGIIPPKNLASVATSGVIGQPKGTVGAPMLDVVARAIDSETGAKIAFTVAPERFPVVDAFHYLRSGLPHLKDGDIRNLENLWKLKVRAADGSMRRLDFNSTREFLRALPEDEAPIFNVVGQWNYAILADSIRIEHLKTGQVVISKDSQLYTYFVSLVFRALSELYENGMAQLDLPQFKPDQAYWDFLNGVLQGAMRGRNGLNLMEVTDQAIALNVAGYRIFLNRADNEVYIVPPGQLPGIIPSDLTEWFLTQISFGIAYSNTAVKDIKAMVTALPPKDQLFPMFDETMRLSQGIGKHRKRSELREVQGMPLGMMSGIHKTLTLDKSDLPIAIDFNNQIFRISVAPDSSDIALDLPKGPNFSSFRTVKNDYVTYEIKENNRLVLFSIQLKENSIRIQFNTERERSFFVVATDHVNLRHHRGADSSTEIETSGVGGLDISIEDHKGVQVDHYDITPERGGFRIKSDRGNGSVLPAGIGSVQVNDYFAVSNFGNGYLLVERLFPYSPEIANIRISWNYAPRSELRNNLPYQLDLSKVTDKSHQALTGAVLADVNFISKSLQSLLPDINITQIKTMIPSVRVIGQGLKTMIMLEMELSDGTKQTMAVIATPQEHLEPIKDKRVSERDPDGEFSPKFGVEADIEYRESTVGTFYKKRNYHIFSRAYLPGVPLSELTDVLEKLIGTQGLSNENLLLYASAEQNSSVETALGQLVSAGVLSDRERAEIMDARSRFADSGDQSALHDSEEKLRALLFKLDQEAIRTHFRFYKKTQLMQSDPRRNNVIFKIGPAGEWVLKLIDFDYIFSAANPTTFAAIAISSFEIFEPKTDSIRPWVWTYLDDKTGFFDAILDAYGKEEGIKFLNDAGEGLGKDRARENVSKSLRQYLDAQRMVRADPAQYSEAKAGDVWELAGERFVVEKRHPGKSWIHYVVTETGERKILKFNFSKDEQALLERMRGKPHVMQGRVLAGLSVDTALLELAGDQTLEDLIVQGELLNIDFSSRVQISLDLVNAYKMIYESGYLLPDIQLSNIVIDHSGSRPDITVIDFGGARQVAEVENDQMMRSHLETMFFVKTAVIVRALLIDYAGEFDFQNFDDTIAKLEKLKVEPKRSELRKINVSAEAAAKKGKIIVSVSELAARSELRIAIQKSITENPNSPTQIAIVAEQFATGVEAEPAVQKLFGDFDIFGKQSGTNHKPRAQLYARDRLGIARELSMEQAYSKLVDMARTELIVTSGLTTRIVAIGGHDLLTNVKQKVAKIISEGDVITLAELLVTSDDAEQYLKFADEYGIVNPTAALIDSLVKAILEKALVESAA